MNNSFIFTPPTGKSATPSQGQEFKTSRKADVPTQPFSNVLDRAVRTSPKPKHDSLAGGRSAEQRSEGSAKTREDDKPAAPQRSNKRKDKSAEEDAIQPAICAGLPLPVIPIPLVVAPMLVEAEIETVIMATGCSDTKSPTTEVAGAVITDAAKGSDDLTASKASADLIEAVNPYDAASDETLAAELKPVALDKTSEALQQTKIVGGLSQLNPEMADFTRDVAEASVDAPKALTISTAREITSGISVEESISKSDGESIDAAAETSIATAIIPDEARRTIRAARRAWAESLENDRGTGGAKITVSMNNAGKKEEIAGVTQQNLPGAESARVASMLNLPSESLRGLGGEISGVDALNAAARSAGGPTRADDLASGELLEMRGASPAVRMGEVISREVRMFKRGGDDLVEVVLTPDTKTQISLKLQWRDGQVEVQARCDMGDHRSLNTEWPQLQASLAAHGVRLSHLSERVQTGFTEFFSNSGFSQQHGGERQPASQQGAADVATPTVVRTTKPGTAKSVIRASNRLESWA